MSCSIKPLTIYQRRAINENIYSRFLQPFLRFLPSSACSPLRHSRRQAREEIAKWQMVHSREGSPVIWETPSDVTRGCLPELFVDVEQAVEGGIEFNLRMRGTVHCESLCTRAAGASAASSCAPFEMYALTWDRSQRDLHRTCRRR